MMEELPPAQRVARTVKFSLFSPAQFHSKDLNFFGPNKVRLAWILKETCLIKVLNLRLFIPSDVQFIHSIFQEHEIIIVYDLFS